MAKAWINSNLKVGRICFNCSKARNELRALQFGAPVFVARFAPFCPSGDVLRDARGHIARVDVAIF